MYGYFHDEQNVYFVMEFAEKGTLFDHFERKKRFSEPETAKVPKNNIANLIIIIYKIKIVVQIASALDYMSQRMVIHRGKKLSFEKQQYIFLDLKLENILLDSNNNVKIADFGWAVHTKSQRKRETLCGTVQCEKFK